MACADVWISLSCGTRIILPLACRTRVFLFGWSAVFLPLPETTLAGWLAPVKECLARSRGHRALARRGASLRAASQRATLGNAGRPSPEFA